MLTGGITIDTTSNLDISAETTINDNLNIGKYRYIKRKFYIKYSNIKC